MNAADTSISFDARNLNELATVRQGYHFRKKIEPDPTGNTYVIQASDISQSREVSSAYLVAVKGSKIKPTYHLSPGSILVKSRGTNYSAAEFNIPGITAVAAYHFIVVTITSQDIVPGYLCWYINRPETQYELSLQAGGSYIKALPAKALESLHVPIPPMKHQELIVNVIRLAQQEASLIDEIKTTRDQVIQSILNSSVSGQIRIQP